uniref:Placenta associated 9 n=1 Tax=Canis lupus familiaris TaxID=9615 RepID=A0A8P0TUK0_CANLF
MRPLLCALAGLALLRAAAAEPFVPSHGDPAWNTGCDRHMAVHDRLDVIEEITLEHWSQSHPAAGSDLVEQPSSESKPCILACLPQ